MGRGRVRGVRLWVVGFLIRIPGMFIAIVVAYATSQGEYLVEERGSGTYVSGSVRVLAPWTFVAR